MKYEKYAIFYAKGKSSSKLLFEVINRLNVGEVIIIDILTTKVETMAIGEVMDCTKLIFIMPEYNGSYPGQLKMLIDSLPIDIWANKKAMLIGYSGGFSGNIKGISHLSDVLNYLKVNVHYNRLYIPNITDNIFEIDGNLQLSEDYSKKLSKYIKSFITF